jgi:hypothetical protein
MLLIINHIQDRKKIYGFKEQCKSVEDVPLTNTKAKGEF